MLLGLGYLISQPTKENFITKVKTETDNRALYNEWFGRTRDKKEKRWVRVLVVVFVRGPGRVYSLLIGVNQQIDWKDSNVAIDTTKSGKKKRQGIKRKKEKKAESGPMATVGGYVSCGPFTTRIFVWRIEWIRNGGRTDTDIHDPLEGGHGHVTWVCQEPGTKRASSLFLTSLSCSSYPSEIRGQHKR